MNKQMTLSTDRKSASEGEFIDIKWNCDACPDSLLLSIDSGYKCDTIAVADSGSTRYSLGISYLCSSRRYLPYDSHMEGASDVYPGIINLYAIL